MIKGLILGVMLLNSGNAVESLEMNILHPYNVVENVNTISVFTFGEQIQEFNLIE